jgi:enterochelin esterase-like enzyme
MREAILFAIDNGNDRRTEYIPPGDQLSGQPLPPPGTVDKYVQFLRDNVLPTLDYNYRTLNQPGQQIQPAANITAGSSLGGLVTAYIGMTNSSVFGKIGVFSPAFWAGPNLLVGCAWRLQYMARGRLCREHRTLDVSKMRRCAQRSCLERAFAGVFSIRCQPLE